MSDLTRKQEGFVNDYLDGDSGVQAALKNYDTTDYSTAGVIAHENLKKPKIIKAIEDAAEGAFSRIVELSQIAQNENVKLSANKDIVDRAGYKPVERTDLTSGGKPLILPAELINKNDSTNTSQDTEDSSDR